MVTGIVTLVPRLAPIIFATLPGARWALNDAESTTWLIIGVCAERTLPPRKQNEPTTANRFFTRFLAVVFKSLHADCHCVTRADEINQPHLDSRSRHNTVGHAEVYLVVSGIAGEAEIQGFAKPATDSHLRRDHTALSQVRSVHRENLSRRGGVTGRCGQSGRGVPDGALPFSIARE